ncbi:hypothetical protein AOL_s00006g74 [Orbilia oligospora ATCC 24927]|uniref:Hemerythrin-like domain-containing protein n=1 Tax=Arthrobotrys oligospora (strain ATCC 24927 / CBS 115.81 / DSM 1491) TaxID=756982 RepID=G1WZM3_ARTOA|nr:hypothetical protein AOL_s00006g74 [Orbilia oligospora ATCC 24927]EGX53616.1 hypothetical protein AOL_s00006g74 [Orbilia oligospora ATCC 24927]
MRLWRSLVLKKSWAFRIPGNTQNTTLLQILPVTSSRPASIRVGLSLPSYSGNQIQTKISRAEMSDDNKFCDQTMGAAEDNAEILNATSASKDVKEPPVQAESSQKVEAEKPLPKLTAAEFKAYNRLAVVMDQYHNHFRATWTEIITGLRKSRPKNQSLRQFLSIAQGFCRMLDAHHNIEESYFFPILAKKMPAFQKHNKEHGEMIAHHRQIHKGLDKFEDYVNACKSGEKDFVASDMLELMESFEKVLWQHLDEEVQQLGAENMRKYWTLEELKMIPM